MKLKLSLDNEETRKVWEIVERAAANVANWPPSKRGGVELPSASPVPTPEAGFGAAEAPIPSARVEA